MTNGPHPRAVENFTTAFLAMSGLLLFVALWTLAALAGFLWVGIAAVVLDRAIGRLPRRD